MKTKRQLDISIQMSGFFLKNVGVWMSENSGEECRRNLTFAYTMSLMLVSIFFEIRDLYFTWCTNGETLYVVTNILSTIIATIKLYIIMIHKVEFIDLIEYMQEKFWNVNYDLHEKEILNNCRRKCIFFVSSVTSIGVCVMIFYLVTPFVVHSQTNVTERIHPFNLWIAKLIVSPYYEVMYIIEVSALYCIGVCYFSFDNMFCILAIHLTGQFRILQYRFAKLCDTGYQISGKNRGSMMMDYTDIYYRKFRTYAQQHQALIDFCEKLENVYTMITLGQVLVFSVLICLFGYQILLADTTAARRSIFIFLVAGAMCLLFMFTYSCDCVMRQSDDIAIGAYSALWTMLPMTKYGRMVRKDIIMVIARSRRVCCLTAYGFFPVSLETYTTILSTAVSYFTLLRNNVEG